MSIRCLAVCLVCISFCISLVACGGAGGGKPVATDPKADIVPQRTENEGSRYSNELKEKVSELLAKKDFDGLDKMAEELRKSKSETACGRWKLDSFYWSFAHDGLKLKKDIDWEQRVEALKEWADKKPASITARIALANLKWRYAWFARGGGWAKDVNDDNWRKMNEREADALKILEGVQPDCPRWYFVRLELAKDMTFERKDYDGIFERSVSQYPSYKHAYFLKARCLQPRWHGGDGEWEKFAEESANKVGGDEGDVLYAQIVWDIDATEWYSKDNLFKQFRLSWPRIQKGFTVMLAKNPDSTWIKSEYAKLACLAEDRATARAMFDKINPDYDPVVWRKQQSFVRQRDWAYTLDGSTTSQPAASQSAPAQPAPATEPAKQVEPRPAQTAPSTDSAK